MFKSILVPLDLADTDLAKPAIATAATLSQTWNGSVRLLNVLPMTPVMLAEYVPADFDAQQRATSEEALAIVAKESGIEASRISTAVRQGGIYHEILEEAAAMKPDALHDAPEIRIDVTAHRRFNPAAFDPDIAERTIIQFAQGLDGLAARKIGDDAVHPASEQAEESARDALGRRLACRRIDR